MSAVVAAGWLLFASVLPPGGTFLDDDLLPGEPAIEAIAGEAITEGCQADWFCPKEPVTRGEMATFLGRALQVSPAQTETSPFLDVAIGAFYADHVLALAEMGIVRGETSERFAPNRAVTRAEMAVLLSRAFALGSTDSSQFADVDEQEWFAGAVVALRAAGITQGCAADRFCPQDLVTREQMAIFLSRVMKLNLPTVPVRTSPMDGLPALGVLTHRRVIGVKVDNAAPARPQSGIESADAMIELMVEGGLSRMMALFLESDSEYLGPVRSVRPTDALVEALGGTIGISGGQPWIADMLATEGIELIRESEVKPPAMFRISGRAAPHNLYTNTHELRAEADRRGLADEPPPDLVRWGSFPYSDAPWAGSIDVSWSDPVSTIWTWDGERYLRSQGTDPHFWLDRAGNLGRVAAENLIVIFGRYYEVNAPTGTGRVPAMQTIGSGRAVLFSEGRVIEGIWSRPDNETWFTFSTPEGEMIVPPGFTWFHVIPHDRPLTWS